MNPNNKYLTLNNNNNIYNIKTQNDTGGDIDEIFEYWNSKGLIRHKKINKNIEEAISKALKEYEIDDILDAIIPAKVRVVLNVRDKPLLIKVTGYLVYELCKKYNKLDWIKNIELMKE